MIVQCPDCTTRYQLDSDRVPRERIRVRCPKCRYVFAIEGQLAGEHAPSGRVAPATDGLGFSPPSAPVTPVTADSSPRSGATAPAYGEVSLSGAQPRVAVDSAPVAPSLGAQSSSGPSVAADSAPTRTVTPEVAAEVVPEVVPERSAPTATMTDPAEKDLDLEIERGDVAPPPPVVESEPAVEAPRPAARVDASAAASSSKAAVDPTDEKSRRLARALVSDILVYNRDTRDQALAQGNLVQALGQEIKKSWELYKEKVTPEVANSNNYFREALNEILADGQKIF